MKVDQKRPASQGAVRASTAPAYEYPLPSSSSVMASTGHFSAPVSVSPQAVSVVSGSTSRAGDRHHFTFTVKPD